MAHLAGSGSRLLLCAGCTAEENIAFLRGGSPGCSPVWTGVTCRCDRKFFSCWVEREPAFFLKLAVLAMNAQQTAQLVTQRLACANARKLRRRHNYKLGKASQRQEKLTGVRKQNFKLGKATRRQDKVTGVRPNLEWVPTPFVRTLAGRKCNRFMYHRVLPGL